MEQIAPTAPKAFLLHGYLGAGKTTFAKRLEPDHRAVRFTHDEWMSTLYGDDPPEDRFEESSPRVFEVMEGVWTRCLALGVSVVLDFGFWSRLERERVRNLVAAHGGEPVLYRLTCADDVARERIAARNRELSGNLHISANTFEVLKPRFEALGPDEQRIEIDRP